jgi:hypothetical protein
MPPRNLKSAVPEYRNRYIGTPICTRRCPVAGAALGMFPLVQLRLFELLLVRICGVVAPPCHHWTPSNLKRKVCWARIHYMQYDSANRGRISDAVPCKWGGFVLSLQKDRTDGVSLIRCVADPVGLAVGLQT